MEPPRPARWLLEVTLPGDERESITGDLLEVFRARCATGGRTSARFWYWGQSVSFAVLFLRERWRERRMGSRAPEPQRAASRWHAGSGLGAALPPTWPGTRGNRRWQVSRFLEAWGRDLRHAARNLLRSPGFALVTVLTLGLAIGANTAIFSVIDAVLINPLPYPEPNRLVTIQGSAPGSDLPPEFGVGTEFYLQYRENAKTLADLGLYQRAQTTVRSGNHVERLFVSTASPSLFSTLGVEPVLGRLPTAEDEEGTVVVLSHWLWTQWFGGDPAVLGRVLEISGSLRTVIGVMGPRFRFPDERRALWVHDLPTEPIRPGGFGLNLVGRLAPGADRAALTAELNTLAKRLPERFGGSPAYRRIIEQHRAVVHSLKESLVGSIETPLWILLGTVGVVLLIACANVANLLIARAESRRRDLAVRRALGAGRAGLVRAQMAEALLLAGLGGIGGTLLAWVGVSVLVRAAPTGIPRLSSVGINATALLFTVGVSLLAAGAAGLLPAIRFSNPGLVGGLRDSARVGPGPGHITRDALVVVQTAAALVLLVSSGLLVQSFRALSHVDPGFDTEDIFTFQMAPEPQEYGGTDGPALARFHYAFMDRLAALPGVTSVGLVNTLPLDEGAPATRFASERTEVSGREAPLIHYTLADGGYFRTMGIRLLSGRLFERRDQPTSDVGVIVSRSAADLLWPGEAAVGKRVRSAADSTAWVTVIGVVNDVLLTDFREQKPDPMIYLPMVGRTPQSWRVGTPAYVVKTARAETIAPEIRRVIHEVAPSAPMYRISTMAGLAARSWARLSFTMLTLAIAAGLALVLGAVGLYGVLSYVVSQRTREIGIRMALGAQAQEVRRMVVVQGSRVTLLGVVVGIAVALLVTQVLGSLLFGVRAIDAPTIVAMSALMLGVALLASYIPARRASSVDPMQSLRAE